MDIPYILEHNVFNNTGLCVLLVVLGIWAVVGSIAYTAVQNNNPTTKEMYLYGLLCGPISWLYLIAVTVFMIVFIPGAIFYDFIEKKVK